MQADVLVHAIASDWRTAHLPDPERALCAFADKLTTDQRSASADDLEQLRAQGFDDRSIHDAVQIIAYFNYIARVADGLGIEEEAGIHRWGEERGHGAPDAADDRPHIS